VKDMPDCLSESRLYAESVKFSGDTLTIRRKALDDSNEINALFSLHNLHITPLITPIISNCIDNVTSNLKIPRSAVTAYVYSSKEINASCTAGNDVECIIQLSSGLIDILEDDELEFVIGHELGHFLYSHSLTERQSDNENLEFFSQKRAQEFSADRIGLISCGNLNASIRAMIKTVSGLSSKHLKFDIGEFISQLGRTDNLKFSSNFKTTHPPMLVRSRALLWFSTSEAFISEQNHYISSEIEEIDKKIQKDIDKYVDPAAIEIINELKDSVKLWLSASLIIEDGHFDKNEQEQFERSFGKDKLEKLKVFISSPNAKMNVAKKLEVSIHHLSQEIPSKIDTEMESIEKEIRESFV
jgi:hypothetical protein